MTAFTLFAYTHRVAARTNPQTRKRPTRSMLPAFIVIASLFSILPLHCFAQGSKQMPKAKVVALDAGGKDYLQVLSGPPETASMKSGLVILQPDHSVGKHTTGHHEEVLVVLEGQGIMMFKGGSNVPVEANHAVYCPPETEHDVKNTGSSPLRYVYIVADAR